VVDSAEIVVVVRAVSGVTVEAVDMAIKTVTAVDTAIATVAAVDTAITTVAAVDTAITTVAKCLIKCLVCI
jgi:hypothetical protein